MKRFVSLLAMVFLVTCAKGQNYEAQFDQFIENEDFAGAYRLLQQWEWARPNDPELLTSYFNYYFSKSKTITIVNYEEEPVGKRYYKLKQNDGDHEFYQVYERSYDRDILNKGFEKIDVGITRFPNRLDMRLGKIYVLGRLEEWDLFTREILQTLRYSHSIGHRWKWSNNEVLEDGESDLLGALQDYQLQLSQSGSPTAPAHIQTIALAMLEYYPDDPVVLNNLATTYFGMSAYRKALEVLLRAHQFAPKDGIVLMNIARSYYMLDNNALAIRYLEKMLSLDDPQMVEYAKEQIESLNKQ